MTTAETVNRILNFHGNGLPAVSTAASIRVRARGRFIPG